MIKCRSCGKEHENLDGVCPYCGCVDASCKVYESKVAEKLDRKLPFRNCNLSYLNLIFILCVNTIIISWCANLVLYFTISKVLWAHYVTGACVMIYLILRTTFFTGERRVSLIAIFGFLLIAVCNVTQFSTNADVLWATSYVAPITVFVIDVITLCYHLFAKPITVRMIVIYTSSCATMTAMEILMRVLDTARTTFGEVAVWVALGFAIFVLFNYLTVKLMNFFMGVKRMF